MAIDNPHKHLFCWPIEKHRDISLVKDMLSGPPVIMLYTPIKQKLVYDFAYSMTNNELKSLHNNDWHKHYIRSNNTLMGHSDSELEVYTTSIVNRTDSIEFSLQMAWLLGEIHGTPSNSNPRNRVVHTRPVRHANFPGSKSVSNNRK